MDISTSLATDILLKMKEIINQDLNYININGVIIASTDPKRVGDFHEASLLCIKKAKEVIIENDEQYVGSRKGINMPIYFDDNIIGVIGITGEKSEVEKYGEIIRMMTGILIKEAWIKDQDIRKKEIIKAFIERIILDYEHDIYPMKNFIFLFRWGVRGGVVGWGEEEYRVISESARTCSIFYSFYKLSFHRFLC